MYNNSSTITVRLLPAIDWVNIPKGRVLKNDVGNDDALGVHELNKIGSGELKGSLPPHVPPDVSLAINSPIFT